MQIGFNIKGSADAAIAYIGVAEGALEYTCGAFGCVLCWAAGNALAQHLMLRPMYHFSKDMPEFFILS